MANRATEHQTINTASNVRSQKSLQGTNWTAVQGCLVRLPVSLQNPSIDLENRCCLAALAFLGREGVESHELYFGVHRPPSHLSSNFFPFPSLSPQLLDTTTLLLGRLDVASSLIAHASRLSKVRPDEIAKRSLLSPLSGPTITTLHAQHVAIMAGKVGKRKSESTSPFSRPGCSLLACCDVRALTFAGALPTGRSKQQKAVASRGDDSDSGRVQDESDDPLFVQQEPVAAKYVKKSTIKSRKSEPVKRAPRVDEYEEDEGRMEGQYVLLVF